MVYLVASSGGFGSLFTALGLNTQAFLLNTAAFLVTAFIVGKWVFPPLTRALDSKKDELEAATRLEQEASGKLEEASAQAAQVVREARKAAEEILTIARGDGATQIEAAQKKAREQADRLVAEAREQLARDVLAARGDLKAETAKLVALATEEILGEKLDGTRDADMIKRSLATK
jgi:F-type H+-transporting ATPase subunit b